MIVENKYHRDTIITFCDGCILLRHAYKLPFGIIIFPVWRILASGVEDTCIIYILKYSSLVLSLQKLLHAAAE